MQKLCPTTLQSSSPYVIAAAWALAGHWSSKLWEPHCLNRT